MKLICSQRDLSHHLAIASRAVASRPSVPVLANVLLVADEVTQTVKLSAFDLSIGIQTSFPAQVETGGTITLPSRLLNDIVPKLPDGVITITCDDTKDNMHGCQTILKHKVGKYQVRGMSADEFPELPDVDSDAFTLPTEALLQGIKGVLFCASDDETKQVLTGVHLSATSGLEFAATDSHRLAVMVSELEDVPTLPEGVNITGKALQEVVKLSEGEEVSVKLDQTQAVFEWANQRLTTRLLEGQYPNYGQLIPKQFDKTLTVDRRQLMAALERIAVLADQKNNIVKFSLSAEIGEEVTLSVDAPDVGSGVEVVSATYLGDDLDIAFNVKYLLEGLKAVPTSEVMISLNTATSPVVITPIGGAKQTYLIMPVQIRS